MHPIKELLSLWGNEQALFLQNVKKLGREIWRVELGLDTDQDLWIDERTSFDRITLPDVLPPECLPEGPADAA
jgi:hypothetical protein